MSSRVAFRTRDFSKTDFDTNLDAAINILKQKCPNEFETVLGYLRSLAMPLEFSPELTETIKASYHRVVVAAKIVRRLEGFDDV